MSQQMSVRGEFPRLAHRELTEKTLVTTLGEAAEPPLHGTIFYHDNFGKPAEDLYVPSDGSIWGWKNIGEFWNDQISSIVVHSGFWAFYQDFNFNQIQGGTTGGFAVLLVSGGYPWVENVGILNDKITSIKASKFRFRV